MSETPPPDWQARAIAFAEAYDAWSRTVIEAMQPSMEALGAWLQQVADALQPRPTSARRARRSYRRDLHRDYRRRYHQRPPLTRKEYEG